MKTENKPPEAPSPDEETLQGGAGSNGPAPIESTGSEDDEQDRTLDALLEVYAAHQGGERATVSLTELRAHALGELDGDRAVEVARLVSGSEELQDLVERYRNPDPRIHAAARKGFLEGLRRLEADRSRAKGAASALASRPREAREIPFVPPSTRPSRRPTLASYLVVAASTFIVGGLALFLVLPAGPHASTELVSGTMTFEETGLTRGAGEPVERLVVGEEIPLRLTPPRGAKYAFFILITEKDLEVSEVAGIRPGTTLRRRLMVQDAPSGPAFLLLVYLERETRDSVLEQAIRPLLGKKPGLIDVSRNERNERIREVLSALDIGPVWMETSTLLLVAHDDRQDSGKQGNATP